MKVLCILRRHKWRVDNTDPERPYEVCDRCGHYRTDGTDPTAEANKRHWDHPPPSGSIGPNSGVGGWS